MLLCASSPAPQTPRSGGALLLLPTTRQGTTFSGTDELCCRRRKGLYVTAMEGYYKSEAGNPGLAMVTRLLHTNTASSLEASIVGQADWLLFITRARVQSLAFLPLQ